MNISRTLVGLVLVLSLMVTHSVNAYQALIFDCDGVLVDSEHLKFTAWKMALADETINFQENDYLPLVGYDSVHIINAISEQNRFSFNKAAVIVKKERIYHDLQKQGITPLPDAVNFLKLAIAKKEALGLKIAIASSAPKREILENLQQLGISPSSFDLIISGKDDLQHIDDASGVNKPKPYIYQICAKTLDVHPSQCLVFEDSSAGVWAAARAGMDVIAIPNRFTQDQDFSPALKIAEFKDIKIEDL